MTCKGLSQSLAGRTALLHLLPLERRELLQFDGAPSSMLETIWQGGYPTIPERGAPAQEWLAPYFSAYVERDVRQLINVGDLRTFQTFVRLVAGRAGQLVNFTALAADCGVAQGTAKAWLSALEASFVIFLLPPYHANFNKRLVKTSKFYFYDTGLLCYLLGIRSPEELRHHPARGAVFENWVLTEVMKLGHHRGHLPRVHFYRDRKGLEVDGVIPRGQALLALEMKSGQTIGSDFFNALKRFSALAEPLSSITGVEQILVYGGDAEQRRAGIRVVPWARVDEVDWHGLNQ